MSANQTSATDGTLSGKMLYVGTPDEMVSGDRSTFTSGKRGALRGI